MALNESDHALDPDAHVPGNLYDLLSTCGFEIDDPWREFDTVELIDVSPFENKSICHEIILEILENVIEILWLFIPSFTYISCVSYEK